MKHKIYLSVYPYEA